MSLDLFTFRTAAEVEAAHSIKAALDQGKISRSTLNKAMRSAFGSTNADGGWTQRDSFEALECGIALHLQSQPKPRALAELDRYARLMQALPTQTVRSEDQIQYQQFSTPADLGALAAVLAQASPEDIVLEPSAGNGLLAAHLPVVKQLFLNELEPQRRSRLGYIFPHAAISGHDGAMINSTMSSDPRPTLILINPPFSKTAGRGDDANAAARHLHSALRRLAPGGRCVAIMPDWFKPSGPARNIYLTVLDGTSVQTSAQLKNCYAKHGTSITVRLLVIDKVPGNICPSVIARKTVAALITAISITKRAPAAPELPGRAEPVKRATTSLFRSMRAAKPTPAPIIRAPLTHNVIDVEYTVLEEPRPIGEQCGIYLSYRPSRIDIKHAQPHPTPLVESVAMGSIPAPKPSYCPKLYDRILENRILSEPQLETLIYAGDAWEQTLPGTFSPSTESLSLKPDDAGRAYRKGYFLGDGTGAGKGRQISACILDNWLHGRRKHIWVTKNEQLLEDARRDWSALGGLSADVQPLSRWKIDEPVRMNEGILFVTYPTIRSQRQDTTRLKQILDWAGLDFDGVLFFDEAHEMGGVAGGEGARGKKEGSQQGIAGVQLQNHLAGARVGYASATGASDVNNFAYAVRLGLWGEHTAFANRETFIDTIRKGGIAAMELLARDLKATGLYASRALSFAGVEYDILKHELTPEQIAIYDAYADYWSIIHRNLRAALEQTGVVDELTGDTQNSGAKSAAHSRFESTKQRFFGQLLLSMKLPTLIKTIEAHLARQKSVVIQLVTTAESVLNRRIDQLSPDERANLDIDLSPREAVVDYLERAFPVQQMETFVDETDKVRSSPMYDEAGHPVFNPEALRARAELIEHICALPAIKPALDALVEHFGIDQVAEVTGRTKRLIVRHDGSQQIQTRSMRSTLADAADFMDGKKRILVFSDAGGTGRSYHASLTAKNQQQRVHFLLEPGWRADRAIQGLGRTHRTHQATTPLFRPVTTNVKGELRFTSTIARRLDSLGALTRGQRQTGGQNLFDPADNLESVYAMAALNRWFHMLYLGKITSTNLADFAERTGLKLVAGDGTMVEDLPPIQRWLNRILALPIAMQNSIFDEFLGLIEGEIEAARKAGTLDIGVETITVDKAKVTSDAILRTDRQSGATTHLLTIEYEAKLNPTTLEAILDIAGWEARCAFLKNGKSGKVGLRTARRSVMTETGDVIHRYAITRPTRTEYFLENELAESAWEKISSSEFQGLWEAEYQEAKTRIHTKTVHVATGLLLPVWTSLPSLYLTVNRIVADDGRSWLGRIIHETDVPDLLAKFGIDCDVALTAEAIGQALERGSPVSIQHPWPATLKPAFANRERRFEIVGAPAEHLPWLKSCGCYTEIIAYRTRVFLPVAQLNTVVQAITAR